MPNKIKKWWDGKYVPPLPADNFDWLGSIERHWSSRFAHIAVDFYRAHWKWLISALIAIAAITVKKF